MRWWRRSPVAVKAVSKGELQSENVRLKKENRQLASHLDAVKEKAREQGEAAKEKHKQQSKADKEKIRQLESDIKISESERDKLLHVAARDLERVKAERAVAQEAIGEENN